MTTGWQAPISALQHWINGVPAPNMRIITMNKSENGFITALEKDGWQLTFQQPKRVKRWHLPGKLRA